METNVARELTKTTLTLAKDSPQIAVKARTSTSTNIRTCKLRLVPCGQLVSTEEHVRPFFEHDVRRTREAGIAFYVVAVSRAGPRPDAIESKYLLRRLHLSCEWLHCDTDSCKTFLSPSLAPDLPHDPYDCRESEDATHDACIKVVPGRVLEDCPPRRPTLSILATNSTPTRRGRVNPADFRDVSQIIPSKLHRSCSLACKSFGCTCPS